MTTDSTASIVAEQPALAAQPDAQQRETPLPSAAQVLEALRTFPRTPYRPPAVNLRDDVPANGELFIVTRGEGVSLALQGGPDFIARWHNWAVNTGLIGAQAGLHYYLARQVGQLAYVCVPSVTAIRQALAMQFAWEIRRDREIAPLQEGWWPDDDHYEPAVWPEEQIAVLAAERADAFVTERMAINSVLLEALAAPIDDTQFAVLLPGNHGQPKRWISPSATEDAA